MEELSMKRLLNCALLLTLGLVLMSGSALAWDATGHVTVAPNGKGDAGIFPIYVALEGGWETKVEIINTSANYSVVAKMIIRTARYSQEVLDFFIYLSPRDVCTGYLNYGPNGPRMYSTDGSVLAGTRATGPLEKVWASKDLPMNVELYDNSCDQNELGYAEVVECWWQYEGVAPDLPLDHDDIYDGFAASSFAKGGINTLAMHYEINYAPLFNAADRATVLRDYNATGTKYSLGNETFLGSEAGSQSLNSICEVESVLAKNRIAMPYYANGSAFAALHMLTFPTKYTRLNSDCSVKTVKSPFFLQHAFDDPEFCIVYGLFWADLAENTPNPPGNYSPVPEQQKFKFCYELNLLSPGAIAGLGFDEGWMNYEFDYATSCEPESAVQDFTMDTLTFYGAPVIPTTLLVEDAGMSLLTGAWDDGDVYYNQTPEPFYHYGPYDMYPVQNAQ